MNYYKKEPFLNMNYGPTQEREGRGGKDRRSGKGANKPTTRPGRWSEPFPLAIPRRPCTGRAWAVYGLPWTLPPFGRYIRGPVQYGRAVYAFLMGSRGLCPLALACLPHHHGYGNGLLFVCGVWV